jgi:hypothetical protein
MTKIVAIRGTRNVGKTTSIKMALEDLLLQNPSAIITKIANGVDVIVVVEINGVIIVFASAGDTEQILKKLLAKISHIDWDYLICATKTYGRTVELIEEYNQSKSTSTLVWIDKNYSTNQQAENKKTATDIIDNIK